MPSKTGILMTILLLAGGIHGEIIQQSHLKKTKKPFALIRNPFLPGVPVSGTTNSNQPQLQVAEEKKTAMQDEIRQSIVYTGFSTKGTVLTAILTISGETYFVNEQETVLERIKIIKITAEAITVEYEGQSVEIPLNKGT